MNSDKNLLKFEYIGETQGMHGANTFVMQNGFGIYEKLKLNPKLNKTISP